jgi:hypothetical protein
MPVHQRFVSYRSMGRIAGKAVVAPVEDLLASHGEYLRKSRGASVPTSASS